MNSTNSSDRNQDADQPGDAGRAGTGSATFSEPRLGIKDAVLPLQRGKRFHAVSLDDDLVERLRAAAAAAG